MGKVVIRLLAIGTAVIGVTLLISNLLFPSNDLLIISVRCLLSALCFVLFLLPEIRKHTRLLMVLLVAIGSLQWVVVESLYGVDFSRPPMTLDSAFFEYAGWLISKGKTLYIDIWDIKPPLTFAVTVPLAWIAQGNMFLMHILSVIICVLFAISNLWMASAVVQHLTPNPAAKQIAPLCLLATPGYLTFALTGFRPEYPFLLFGLLAIWLSYRRKPFWAGCTAGISIAFYLPGLIFLCVTVWLNRKHVGRTFSGILLIALVTVAPVILWGALVPMINQVVVVHILVSEGIPMLLRLRVLVMLAKHATIFLPIGVIASMLVARKIKWIPYALLGGGVILILDLDGYTDLFLVMLLCALAISAWESHIGWWERNKLSFALTLAVISIIWMGGFNIVHKPIYRGYYIADDTEPMWAYYWDKTVLEHCHYRLSKLELGWIKTVQKAYPDVRPNSERHCLVPQTIDETVDLFQRLR